MSAVMIILVICLLSGCPVFAKAKLRWHVATQRPAPVGPNARPDLITAQVSVQMGSSTLGSGNANMSKDTRRG